MIFRWYLKKKHTDDFSVSCTHGITMVFDLTAHSRGVSSNLTVRKYCFLFLFKTTQNRIISVSGKGRLELNKAAINFTTM